MQQEAQGAQAQAMIQDHESCWHLPNLHQQHQHSEGHLDHRLGLGPLGLLLHLLLEVQAVLEGLQLRVQQVVSEIQEG